MGKIKSEPSIEPKFHLKNTKTMQHLTSHLPCCVLFFKWMFQCSELTSAQCGMVSAKGVVTSISGGPQVTSGLRSTSDPSDCRLQKGESIRQKMRDREWELSYRWGDSASTVRSLCRMTGRMGHSLRLPRHPDSLMIRSQWISSTKRQPVLCK